MLSRIIEQRTQRIASLHLIYNDKVMEGGNPLPPLGLTQRAKTKGIRHDN